MTHDFTFNSQKEFERPKSHEHTRVSMMNSSVNKSSSHTFLPTTSTRRHKDNNNFI